MSDGRHTRIDVKDGVAEIRPVLVGDYVGDKDIVVSTGLHEGDRVVVEGVLKVAPGKPVRVVAPGAAKAGEAAGKGGDAAGKTAPKAAEEKKTAETERKRRPPTLLRKGETLKK